MNLSALFRSQRVPSTVFSGLLIKDMCRIHGKTIKIEHDSFSCGCCCSSAIVVAVVAFVLFAVRWLAVG